MNTMAAKQPPEEVIHRIPLLAQKAEDDILPDYELIGPTKLLPHLFIGSMKDALDEHSVQTHGITHILNISSSCPKPVFMSRSASPKEGETTEHFMRIPVNDGYIDSLLPYLHQTYEFIEKAKVKQGCVLVHCHAGMSRSATVAIAYMMKAYNMTVDQAHGFVKSKRKIVSPNFNFLGQLMDYEKTLRLASSSPGLAVNSGTKRKRSSEPKFSLDVVDADFRPTPAPRPVIGMSSGFPEKRFGLDSQAGSKVHSLSPASAMATLRFEHTLQQNPDLISPTTVQAVLRVPPAGREAARSSSAASTSPPKRCLSWSGLALLGSDVGLSVPDKPRTSHSLPRSKRPNSLSLSTTNLPTTSRAECSSILSISRSRTHQDIAGSGPRRPTSLLNLPRSQTVTGELEIEGPSSPIYIATPETPPGPTRPPRSIWPPRLSQSAEFLLSDSDPKWPEAKPRSQSDVREIASAYTAPREITSTYTAPSNLPWYKDPSRLLSDLPQRSRSLEFLSTTETTGRLCQKCGRHGKGSKCYASVPRDAHLNTSAPSINTQGTVTPNPTRPTRSLHRGSLEMISVS